MKPLDLRLLKTAGAARWFIAGVVALAVFGMLLTVGFSWELSHYLAAVFAGALPANSGGILTTLALIGAAKAALIWFQDWLGSVAGARAKGQLRTKLLAAITKLGPNWTATQNSAQLTLLATRQLDSLDAYFAKFLPQLVYTTLVTPAFTAVIFANDFWSGLAVLCTLPLIPLFMIFIGWATQGVQQQQLDSMGKMARHFGEVLRGLTTLKVFGRLPNQPAMIAQTSESYRVKTMKVLRVSFLSGMALEVAASLSVALIAVSIGLRLIDGSIALKTGLFVLLLAPETYLPLRQVGAHFHASNEGVTASGRALDIIDEAKRVGGQTGRANVTLFKPGSITRIIGPSGAGKTTAMNTLRASVGAENLAWLPQRIGLLAGTVGRNITAFAQHHDAAVLQQAFEMASLDDVGVDQPVGHDGSAVSGGQAQRIGIARAVYRLLNADCDWLLLDEPFSALDEVRVKEITKGLKRLARSGKTVVVISHQDFEGIDNELTASEVAPIEAVALA